MAVQDEQRIKIIIVEDDENIRTELKHLLENNGYSASYVTEFKTAAEQILTGNPDLVLLDVNLPEISGLSICDQVRMKSDLPIIFVTSNQTSMDELNCIMRGGDDYIAKPYQVPILLARIGMVLKRVKKSQNLEPVTEFEHKGVVLHLKTAELSCGDKSVELTKNELKIMACLFEQKGNIVNRADLIDYLWDNEIFIDDNTLSVNVTRIRGKLEEIDVKDFIETKRGLGYKI